MMLVNLAFNYETRHARLRTDFRERDVACSSWGINSNVFDLLPKFRCRSVFDPMMAGSSFYDNTYCTFRILFRTICTAHGL